MLSTHCLGRTSLRRGGPGVVQVMVGSIARKKYKKREITRPGPLSARVRVPHSGGRA